MVTIAVQSFPMVLFRPMGLKLAGSVWFPFLYSMMVEECFQHVGVSPSIHMRMRSWWMVVCQSLGRAPRSSLGIPSGPGCLFLARCLMHVWYVVASMIRGVSSVVCCCAWAVVSILMWSGPWVSQGPCLLA